MVGIVGLHHNAAGQIATAGAAADLGHQLEDALGGAEVGHGQRVVAAHHADQRDAVNVVAFGDHLRADEQVDLAGVQPRQQPLQVVAAAHGVAIHAADARGGKDFAEPLFALLRACAKIVEMLALALGAAGGDGAPVAAIMALEPLAFAGLVGLFGSAACGG